MAAYASLVSVMHILDQIQHHPRPPISLDKTQVESLTESITLLQEFLEGYSQVAGYNKEADPLEMRIADAAYAAEDVIESHIVDQICAAGSTSYDKAKISFLKFFKCFRDPKKAEASFHQSLEKVIANMDSIKKEVMQIKDQLCRNAMADDSLRSSSSRQNNTMVGFDDILVEIMDKLTGGQPDRQIISVVGMGGTGKTTLARNVYQHQVVVQHFDLRTWVTVSQEYRMRESLLELLQERGQNLSQFDEHELGDQLHKKLSGRRYLIIIDDIWDVQVWDQLRRYFPDNRNGSGIVITTRISNFELAHSYIHKMRFLDMDKSWSMFSTIVFGKEDCPLELEEIGKKIVEHCRGLPLSIVVVGGLLAKSKHRREYWETIAENLNSIVNSEDNENCLKILHMSYNQLPVYLKPCFLYMGVFEEDREIRVSELIRLWVAEGILRPIRGKSLEEVAEEYLEELINRNMVLAHELGSIGNIKYCKVHDLLRDLSLKQAEKERFYNVISQNSCHVPDDTSTQRRIVVPEHTSQAEVRDTLQFTSPVRSLICDSEKVPSLHNFRLLRIMSSSHDECIDVRKEMFETFNSRYLGFPIYTNSKFPSSLYHFWNLQTLTVKCLGPSAPFEIWDMPQLRHLKLDEEFILPDPPRSNIVLRNLQTLATVMNLKCSVEVIKRIPNIRKLKVDYVPQEVSEKGPRDYCVNNFNQLNKIESFCLFQLASGGVDCLQNLTFPHSLKKVTLTVVDISWDDKVEKVGSLPLLETLKLRNGMFDGGKWETVEGHFLRLKFLSVEYCNLEYWKTESSHFPRLEHLVLNRLYELKEIPSEIIEIPTLNSIKLEGCTKSAVVSAENIIEEQEELYGEVGVSLQVLYFSESPVRSQHASSERILDAESDSA